MTRPEPVVAPVSQPDERSTPSDTNGLPSYEDIRGQAYASLGDAADWLRSDWRPGAGPTRDAAAHTARAMAAILRAKSALNDAANACTATDVENHAAHVRRPS